MTPERKSFLFLLLILLFVTPLHFQEMPPAPPPPPEEEAPVDTPTDAPDEEPEAPPSPPEEPEAPEEPEEELPEEEFGEEAFGEDEFGAAPEDEFPEDEFPEDEFDEPFDEEPFDEEPFDESEFPEGKGEPGAPPVVEERVYKEEVIAIEGDFGNSPFVLTGEATLNLPLGIGRLDTTIKAHWEQAAPETGPPGMGPPAVGPMGPSPMGPSPIGPPAMGPSVGLEDDVIEPQKKLRGRIVFEAALKQDLKFAGVRIKKPKAVFATDGTFHIEGDARVLDKEVIAYLNRQKYIDPRTGKRKTKFEFIGQLKSKKPMRPFKMIPIPALKNIKIYNAFIGIIVGPQNRFFVGGKSTILGLTSVVTLDIGGPNKISLQGVPPAEGWVLDKVSPILAPIAAFLSKSALIASSYPYYNEKIQKQIRPGLTFSAELCPHKIPKLEKLFRLYPGEPPCCILSGSIGKPADTSFTAELQLNLELMSKKLYRAPFDIPKIVFKRLVINVAGIPPEISFKAGVEVTPSKKDPMLLFTGAFTIDTTGQFGVEGSMKGMWKGPYGLRGFALEDVGLEFGARIIAPAPPFVVPQRLGFTGTTMIGDRSDPKNHVRAEITGFADVKQLQNIAFYASLDHLTLRALAGIPKSAGISIPMEAVPNLGLKKAELSFSPLGATIQVGEIFKTYDQGIRARGRVEILKKYADADFHINTMPGLDMGIKMHAKMSNFNIGPMKITGAGEDRKYGTEDDGPIAKMALTPKEQELTVSGLVDFFESRGNVEITIDRTGIDIDTKMKLFNVFDSEFHLHSFGALDMTKLALEMDGHVIFGRQRAKLKGRIDTKKAQLNFSLKKFTLRNSLEAAVLMGAGLRADTQRILKIKTEEQKRTEARKKIQAERDLGKQELARRNRPPELASETAPPPSPTTPPPPGTTPPPTPPTTEPPPPPPTTPEPPPTPEPTPVTQPEPPPAPDTTPPEPPPAPTVPEAAPTAPPPSIPETGPTPPPPPPISTLFDTTNFFDLFKTKHKFLAQAAGPEGEEVVLEEEADVPEEEEADEEEEEANEEADEEADEEDEEDDEDSAFAEATADVPEFDVEEEGYDEGDEELEEEEEGGAGLAGILKPKRLKRVKAPPREDLQIVEAELTKHLSPEEERALNEILRRVPNVGFKNVNFNLNFAMPSFFDQATKDFESNGIVYKSKINIPKLKLYGKSFVSISREGLVAEAYMKKWRFGPLVVTGKGRDKVEGTEDDGPYGRIEFSPTKQLISLTGKTNLLGSTGAEIFVDIGKDGFTFDMEAKILGAMEAQIHGKTLKDFTGFIIDGLVRVGKARVALYGRLGQEPDKTILLFSVKEMTTEGVSELANDIIEQMTKVRPIPTAALAIFRGGTEFKSVNFGIAGMEMEFEGYKYEKGLTFDAQFVFPPYLFPFPLRMKAFLDTKGVHATGMMPAFNFGPIKITGAGADEKLGTKDDGPVFHLDLAKEPKLFIDGIVDFFGTKSRTQIYLAGDKCSFETKTDLLGASGARVFVELKDNGFTFNMKTKLLNTIETEIHGEALKEFTGIKLGGKARVGGAKVEIYGFAGETLEQNLVQFTIEEITSEALAVLANDVIEVSTKLRPIPIKAAAFLRTQVELKKLHFGIAGADMEFEGNEYKKGLSFEAQFVLPPYVLPTPIQIKAAVDKEGVHALGRVPAFNFGPIKLTGAGADEKLGTKDDGPILHMELVKEPKVFIDGIVEFFGLKSRTQVQMGKDHFSFETEGKLAGLFNTDFFVKSVGKKSEDFDFIVKGKFKSDFYAELRKHLRNEVKKFQKGVRSGFDKAKGDVNSINKEIEKIDAQIEERNKKIGKLTKAMQKRLWENQAKIRKAQDKVKKERAKVQEAKRKMRAAKNKVREQEKKCKRLNTVLTKPAYWVCIGLFKVAQAGLEALRAGVGATSEVGLQAALAALETAKGTAVLDPRNFKETSQIMALGTEIYGLEEAKGALIISRDSANTSLEGAKLTTVGLSEVGKKIAEGVLDIEKIIDLKEATIDGSLKKFLDKGIMPRVTITATTHGTTKTVYLEFDISNPANTMGQIAGALFKLALTK